jgi:trehalose/maltose transport system permease protein
VVFRLLDALRVFDLIFVLTSNGGSTISMSGFVRREMVDTGDIGFGSAASTSLFLIILLSAWVFLRATKVQLSEQTT